MTDKPKKPTLEQITDKMEELEVDKGIILSFIFIKFHTHVAIYIYISNMEVCIYGKTNNDRRISRVSWRGCTYDTCLDAHEQNTASKSGAFAQI